MHRIRWNALEEGLLLAGSSNVLKIFLASIITQPKSMRASRSSIGRSGRPARESRVASRFTTTSVT